MYLQKLMNRHEVQFSQALATDDVAVVVPVTKFDRSLTKFVVPIPNDEQAMVVERSSAKLVIPIMRNESMMSIDRPPTGLVVPIPKSKLASAAEPMVIYPPIQIPYESTKAVPWNYAPAVQVGGKPIVLKEPDVVNIAGTSGMTRSGRIFSPEVLQNKVVEKTSVPPIVKNTSVTPVIR